MSSTDMRPNDERICEGRVVIVTGAGRGIGREHALELARQGAAVVVNDIGVQLDGSSGGEDPAAEVVELIRSEGGRAVVDRGDVADWDQARRSVELAVETFGDLHAVVNNAGVVRDRMFTNITEDEWDTVMRVHLKGHLSIARHAASRWRDQSKRGESVSGRIVNTSSGAGTYGSIGQTAYATAKAGIAILTINQAAELDRYGVTANAIAPSARTRMTRDAFPEMMAEPVDPETFDAMDPANISPLVAWLVSERSAGVSGRIFEVEGGRIGVVVGYRPGPDVDIARRWIPAEIGPAVSELLDRSPEPTPVNGL